jgi:hypothetical protein
MEAEMDGPDLNQMFDSLEERQRAMLGATRTWADDLTHTLTDGTPIPDEVRKIVDAAFEFSATIADSAREFAKAVMTAMTGQPAEPTAPKSGVPAPGAKLREAPAARPRKAPAARPRKHTAA